MKSLQVWMVVLAACSAALAVEVPLYEECPKDAEAPMKKLLCYYEGSAAVDKINPCMCTHVVYSSAAKIGDNYTLHMDQDLERTSYVLRKRNPALRLVISVSGSAQQSEALAKSEQKRREFVKSVSQYVQEADIDGVEIDFQWATSGGAQAKEGLVELLKLLREKMEAPESEVKSRQKRDYSVNEEQAEDSTTEWTLLRKNRTLVRKTAINRTRNKNNNDNRRKARVTQRSSDSKRKTVLLRVPIKPEIIAKRFDLKYISKYIDMFVVNTHNMTDSSERGVTYHPSRLMGLADILNMDSMLDLLTGLGAPHSMIVVSVPAAATRFTLSDVTKNTPRSPVTQEPQQIGKGELCSLLSEGSWTVERDEDLTAPYAYQNTTWLAFEDRISAGIKGKYVILRDLAGAAVYQLDDEDNSGVCKNVNNNTDSSVLASLHYTFTNLARKSRGALLQTLEEDVKGSTLITYSGDVHLSPYRIVRVIDNTGAVHVVRKEAKTQFECSRQGYYVHPSGCNRFYRCVKFNQYTPDYTVFEYDCPAGLAFDERWEVCVWPGSLPEGSPCTGSSEIAPVPRARYSCPTHEGYFADPENCRWFFACLDHSRDGSPLTAYEFRCPFGLVFDEEKLLCDWPWLVPGCGNAGRAVFVAQAGYGYAAHASLATGQVSGFSASSGSSGAYAAGAGVYSSETHGNGYAGTAGNGYISSSSGSQAHSNGYAGGAGNGYIISSSGSEARGNGYAGASGSAAGSGYASSSLGSEAFGNRYAGASRNAAGSSYASSSSGSEAFGNRYAGASGNAAGSGYVSTSLGSEAYGNRYAGAAGNGYVSSSSGSEAHGNRYAGASGNAAGNGYISSSSGSGSYYEGRNIASYATYPDSLVSGGRIANSGGVVLGEYVAGGGLVGVQRGATVGQSYNANSYASGSAYSQNSAHIVSEGVRANNAYSSSFVNSAVPVATYQQPIVSVPVVQSVTPLPAVTVSAYKQNNLNVVSHNIEGVSIHSPSVSFSQPIVPAAKHQTVVVTQSTPAPQYSVYSSPSVQPVVYQQQQAQVQQQVVSVSYKQPVVSIQQPVVPVVQQPTAYFTQSTAAPISKQEFISYKQPIVQQVIQKPVVTYRQPIVERPTVYVSQSIPRPVVQQEVFVQQPVVPVVRQQPTVYITQSTPRPIVQQEVFVQQPAVPVVRQPPTVYVTQSTPRPIVQQEVFVQQPAVPVVRQQPTVYVTQSTPRPIVQQEVFVQQPSVPVVRQPTAYITQSTPRPAIKQQFISYQQPRQEVVVQQPTVTLSRPIVTPVVKQQIVYTQSTPRPRVYFSQSTPTPIFQRIVPLQKQVIQPPTQFFSQSTVAPVSRQEFVSFRPRAEQVLVKQPVTYFAQSTPVPVSYNTPIIGPIPQASPVHVTKYSYQAPNLALSRGRVQEQSFVRQEFPSSTVIPFVNVPSSTPAPLAQVTSFHSERFDNRAQVSVQGNGQSGHVYISQEPQLVQVSSTPPPVAFTEQRFESFAPRRKLPVQVSTPAPQVYVSQQPQLVQVSTPQPPALVSEQRFETFAPRRRIPIQVSSPAPQVYVSQQPQFVQVSTPQPPALVSEQRFETFTPRRRIPIQVSTPAPQVYVSQQPQFVQVSTPQPPALVSEQRFETFTPRRRIPIQVSSPAPQVYVSQQPQFVQVSTPQPPALVSEQRFETFTPRRRIPIQVSSPAPQVYVSQQPQFVQVSTPQPPALVSEQRFETFTPRRIPIAISAPNVNIYEQQQKQFVQVSTPQPPVFVSEQRQEAFVPRRKVPVQVDIVASEKPQFIQVSTPQPLVAISEQNYETYGAREEIRVDAPIRNLYASQKSQFVQVSTPQPDVAFEQSYQTFETSGVVDDYVRLSGRPKGRVSAVVPIVQEFAAPQIVSQGVNVGFSSYDSRYDNRSVASFVNEGFGDLGIQTSGGVEFNSNEGYVEQANVDIVAPVVTQRPTVKYFAPINNQYHIETSPPRKQLFTPVDRPTQVLDELRVGSTTSAPAEVTKAYLPPSQQTNSQRGRTSTSRKQRPRVQIETYDKDVNIDALLDQYSGRFGGVLNGNKEGFINGVIADDLAGRKNVVSTTQGYVEITTFKPRTKASRKRPTTTTARYEDDDDDSSEEEEDTKLKQPIVVVTQLSDANPILIAKLGAKCTCQSHRATMKSKGRNRNSGRGNSNKNSRNNGGGDADGNSNGYDYPQGTYEQDSVTGDFGTRSNQIPTSTLIPTSDVNDGNIRVVKIRPNKRPSVYRVPIDTGIDSIISTTQRPQINVNIETNPTIVDLENRYIKSGLRKPGYQREFIRPDLPVTIATPLASVADSETGYPDSSEEDVYVVPSSTLRPIIVEEKASVPIALVSRRPTHYGGPFDGSSSNLVRDGSQLAPDASRRRPSNSRRGPGYEVGVDVGAGAGAVVDAGSNGGAGVKLAGRSFDRYGPGGWRSIDETLQGSVDCQRQGLFRHPKYCNKFYACNWDQWKKRFTLHVFNCPVHLAYDTSLGACNWPTKGPACADDNLLV